MKKILIMSVVLAALIGCQKQAAQQPASTAPAAAPAAPATTETPSAAPATPATPDATAPAEGGAKK